MAPLQDPSQFGHLVAGLQDLYCSQLLTDVTLVAGEVEVMCHRCVLAASSPYFRAMFTSDLKERREKTVELHEVPPKLLKPLVEYFYHSEIDINHENVEDLLSTASHLELLELYNMCAQYMVKELHVSNCTAVYGLACAHNHSYLREKSKRFILKHFAPVAESGDLDHFDLDDFLRILSSDDLEIRTEEVVFNTMLKWVEHDLSARKRHLPALLKVVRLGLLSEEFMSDVVEACDLLMKDPFCRSMISLARLQVISGGSIGLISDDDDNDSVQNRPRYGMHCAKLVTFIGASQKPNVQGLGCFYPKTMKNYYAIQLHLGFDFKHRIDHHRAVVTSGNGVYVAGGILFENYALSTSGEARRDFSLFDSDSRSWIPRREMNDRRCAHGLVAIGDAIYAIGGKSSYPEGDMLSSVEVYSVDNDEWSYTPSMPVGLCHHQAITHKDKILVVGGFKQHDQASDTILQFDSLLATWMVFPVKLGMPRAQHGAVIRQDELFVAGGTNGDAKLSTVEVINLEAKKWSRAADFLEERTSPAMWVCDGDVYLCGGMRTINMRLTGETKEMASRDLWKYDVKENSWIQLAKLIPYANTHAYVVAEHNFKNLIESDFISKV